MKKYKLSKKSQMEIMGLMIVVILLVLGVLFAVKFIILKEPADTRQTYSRSQMASNMGLALMSSSTEDCRQTAIKDLMIDCAEWPENGGTILCGNGMKSCEYLNMTVAHILNETFVPWQVKYYLTAGTEKDLESQILYHHSPTCRADRESPGESESFFIPTSRGVMVLKIFICN